MRLLFRTKWAQRVQAALGGSQWTEQRGGTVAPMPAVPVNAEWDEAFVRVESYLRAHQIESRVLVSHLATELLTVAKGLAADHPDEAPVTLAMQILHGRIGEWLVRALGEGNWADERFRARGRLALLMAGVPQRCPERFLSADAMEPEVVSRLTEAALQPGPELRLTGMPPAPLDFPLGEAAEEKWVTFSRSAFFRASTSWFLIAGFLGIAWFATR